MRAYKYNLTTLHIKCLAPTKHGEDLTRDSSESSDSSMGAEIQMGSYADEKIAPQEKSSSESHRSAISDEFESPEISDESRTPDSRTPDGRV